LILALVVLFTSVDVPLMSDRIPPQAVDIEMAVIGAMMHYEGATDVVVGVFTKPEVFYKAAHSIIFKAILQLYNKNVNVDLVTVKDRLEKSHLLKPAGGAYYLTECLNQVTAASNVGYHAKIVYEKYILRQIIETGREIIERGYDASDGAMEILDGVENKILGIRESGAEDKTESIGKIVPRAMDEVEFLQSNKTGIIGVPCGLSSFDNKTGGFFNGDLIIIAANPGVGKTAFAVYYAYAAATKHKQSVGFISLEMTKEQIFYRILSIKSFVPYEDIRRGRATAEQQQKLVQSMAYLEDKPIYINDRGGINRLELRSQARRLKKRYKIDILFVDYLQLMSGVNESSRRLEIEAITRSLKALAKELRIPVVVLSQLSRESAKQNRLPRLDDLRESGSIEQDADTVIMLHRKNMDGDGSATYNIEGESVMSPDDEGLIITEFLFRKQRSGSTGKIYLKTSLPNNHYYCLETRYGAEDTERHDPKKLAAGDY